MAIHTYDPANDRAPSRCEAYISRIQRKAQLGDV
jgi:hypothetical protein